MALIEAFETTTIVTGQEQTKSALLVFGSQDCKAWNPVAGTLNRRLWVDQLTTSPKSGVYKFYSVVFAGRIERSELKEIDFVFNERYNNRLR